MADLSISFAALSTPSMVDWSCTLIESFRRVTGRTLAAVFSDVNGHPLAEHRRSTLALELFELPFIVVSHQLELEPILNYGNRAALRRWNSSWSDFVRMPSSQTAEAAHREERLAAFAKVREYGFVDDYRGVRITADGRRFMIERGTIWEVVDAHGVRHGDAATFSSWTDL